MPVERSQCRLRRRKNIDRRQESEWHKSLVRSWPRRVVSLSCQQRRIGYACGRDNQLVVNDDFDVADLVVRLDSHVYGFVWRFPKQHRPGPTTGPHGSSCLIVDMRRRERSLIKGQRQESFVSLPGTSQ